MKKQVFLNELSRRLQGLPQEDIEERLGFYSEIIDDSIEEGLTEEEAVAKIGTVDEVIAQIASETPLYGLVKEKLKKKRTLRGWEIALIIIGSPIWFSLLIAALAVVFSLYVSVWAIIISFYAVALANAVSGIATPILSFVVFTKAGNPAGIFCGFGAGLVCLGLSALFLALSLLLTKAVVLLTKKTVLGIKSGLIGKENSK